MSAREPAGISQSVSSIRWSSDIQDDGCPPDVAFMREAETVVGGRLHERVELGDPSVHRRREAVVVERERARTVGHERTRVREEDELVQPGDEKSGAVAGFD